VSTRPLTLLLEPFGGLAGDMFLAALLDLEQETFRLQQLEELAAALVPEGLELEREEVRRGSLRATLLHVRTPESAAPPHRHLSDLLRLVQRSTLSAACQERATAILTRIARAESRVHGIGVEEVHFHEVGAVDTLVDVCGAVHALECLGVERVVATPPYVGGGTVHCAHGEMPVPAPGTAELLRGLPRRNGVGGERLTPTGAALLAELVDEFLGPESPGSEAVVSTASGYGAGHRDPEQGPANLVRVSLVRALDPLEPSSRTAWLLECNLDDATPEEVGFLLQELRAAGALEAWSAAIQMKKDRPAVLVSALCRDALRAGLEELCFRHSPTLGVRWTRVERTECARETLELPFQLEDFQGRVRVKVRFRPGGQEPGVSDVSPEFDDLAAIARSTGRPLRELEELVRRAALRSFRSERVVSMEANPRRDYDRVHPGKPGASGS
jgi:uncharacterized protein (TIGR00299 family) protein